MTICSCAFFPWTFPSISADDVAAVALMISVCLHVCFCDYFRYLVNQIIIQNTVPKVELQKAKFGILVQMEAILVRMDTIL